ncbi:MAG: glycerol-3-phosphate 1-O-acyltransferase PlsY [Pseudomonadota bacterium]|nr:glycerol-3-phosphate 1-O-acyltransferase PlsY [Pseudomonadota bacterium]
MILFSYLIGSIPFGFLLTKYFTNNDIREIGSGNIGTTNVLRSGNKVLALLTLIFDIFKGFLPVFIIIEYSPVLASLSAISVFMGHIFPVWLKLKGGKGVATFIGILFSLSLSSAIIFIFSWLLVAFISKKSSLSSLSAASTSSIYIFIFDNMHVYIIIILLIFIFIRHYENIKRLFNKTEPNIKFG